MTVKDIATYIDYNTPYIIKDVDTEEILWKSWDDSFDDIPDYDIVDYGVTWNKKEQNLVLWIDFN